MLPIAAAIPPLLAWPSPSPLSLVNCHHARNCAAEPGNRLHPTATGQGASSTAARGPTATLCQTTFHRLQHSRAQRGNEILKTIFPIATLVYYDGVRVFAGRDPTGRIYVGSMIGAVNGVDRYLVTPVAPEQLRRFCAGQLDLRTLMLAAPAGAWYLTLADGQPGMPLVLQPQEQPLADTDFLPLPDYRLEDGLVDGWPDANT